MRRSWSWYGEVPFLPVPHPTSNGTTPDLLFHRDVPDSQGRARLLSSRVLASTFADIRETRFKRPDRGYTGYAADGFLYIAGEKDPGSELFEASWAQEAEGPHRGARAAFPDRAYFLATDREVVIFDADTQDLWMRFVLAADPAQVLHGTALGSPTVTRIVDIAFIEGWLVVATAQTGVVLVDFLSDSTYFLLSGVMVRFEGRLATRNQITYRNAGSTVSGSSRRLASEMCLSLATGQVVGVYLDDGYIPTVVVGHLGGFSVIRLRYAGSTHPRIARRQASLTTMSTTVSVQDDPPDPENHRTLNPPVDVEAAHLKDGDYLRLAGGRQVAKVFEVHGAFFRTDGFLINSDEDGSQFVRACRPVVTRARALAWTEGLYGIGYKLDLDWLTEDQTPEEGTLAPPAAVAPFPEGTVLTIAGIVADGEDVYVATDRGVYLRAADGPVVLAYGTDTGRYPILPSAACRALALDPDTRRLVVALADSATTTTIVEIDKVAQRVARQYVLPGAITTLTAFPGA